MNQKIGVRSVVAVLVLVVAASTRAQPTQSAVTPLERRAADVCAQFRATPGGYESLFASDFLSEVPAKQLTQIFRGGFNQLGRCTQAKIIKAQDANSGNFSLIFEKGFSVPAEMSVNAGAPNLVTGLLLQDPVSTTTTLNDIVNELKALPGQTSFVVVRLNDDSINSVIAYNADSELAIGSAFKLYVLSELARELNSNERKLSDVTRLDDRFISLPSGTLQTWPIGSPVTLQTLAAFMISVSDNTAADHLLNLLGRERVEQMLTETGHAKPAVDIPFLSTVELFKLKGEPTHKIANDFLALDTAGRRKYLDTQIASMKREDAKPYADGKPSYIDRIEWFASATDLCRVMNWLRQQTESTKAAAPLRDVMAINAGQGMNVSRERWTYIGFKGGSEPGVLNLTYLLRSTNGQWYAMSMSWNNPQATVDTSKMIPLVQRALQIIN